MAKPWLMMSFVVVLLCGSAAAQKNEPSFATGITRPATDAAPPRLAERAKVAPLRELTAASTDAADELEQIYRWNEENRLPLRNGFTRSIAEPVVINISNGSASKGMSLPGERSMIWSGSLRVQDVYRMRIHLTHVSLPAATRFWVYSPGEPAISFGLELLDPEGNLFTPSVGGEVAYLELEIPKGNDDAQSTFTIAGIVELVEPFRPDVASMKKRNPNDTPSCLIDATCVNAGTLDVVDAYRRAVAQLQYVKNGSSFVCTGGLMNDKDTSGTIPYFLTANHCFSTQSSASSLEAFWDYKTASCSGNFPSFSTLQRTNGATLLATSAATDFTFVRLNSIPNNRILLGWDTNPVPAGTTLHRISHPFPSSFSVPAAQAYSSTTVETSSSTCTTKGRPSYLYSNMKQGGVYGGSSGSPVILAGGYVVGQLFGTCGAEPGAGCTATNRVVDGAFPETFPAIASYLNAGPTTTQCVADATTACMLGNRFQVRVRYRGTFENLPGDRDAQVKSVTGFASPAYETAFFYFNNANNIEMLVKLLDQGNIDSQNRPTIAVLFGSATPLRVELTITDTKTGAVKNYLSEFPKMQGTTDFTAFVK